MPGILGVDIVIIAIVFSVVATASVVLRFYCRYIKRAGFGKDDWFIVPALLFSIGVAITNCVAALAGDLGTDEVVGPGGTMTPEAFLVYNQTQFTVQIISIPCYTFAKISVLCFYRRIFRGWIFNTLTWILIASSAAWGISFLVATMAKCTPFEANWIVDLPGAYCYHRSPMFNGTAVANVILDLLILLVPWPNIWQLQLPTRQKFALAGIFMLGALVCGFGLARVVFFFKADQATPAEYADATVWGAPPVYWTQLEASFAIICACLPTLRPLFHGFSPESIFGSRGGRISSKGSRDLATVGKGDSDLNADSSIALHPLETRSKDTITTETPPDGAIVVKHDYNLTFSETGRAS